MTDIPKIALSQGKFALVDAEDFEYLNQWKWYAQWMSSTRSFYARRNFNTGSGRTTLHMHRVILGITDTEVQVDHINHNTLDNRKHNLRICAKHENTKNKKKSSNNTSGFKGVTWDSRRGQWKAKIGYNGKSIHIGYYDDPYAAAKAYDSASNKYHGEFGMTNFIYEGQND